MSEAHEIVNEMVHQFGVELSLEDRDLMARAIAGHVLPRERAGAFGLLYECAEKLQPFTGSELLLIASYYLDGDEERQDVVFGALCRVGARLENMANTSLPDLEQAYLQQALDSYLRAQDIIPIFLVEGESEIVSADAVRRRLNVSIQACAMKLTQGIAAYQQMKPEGKKVLMAQDNVVWGAFGTSSAALH